MVNNMTLNEYQTKTLDTWGGPERLTRAVLSLGEESGECIGKYQKWLRYDYDTKGGYDAFVIDIKKELGDLLFYIAVTAHELNIPLEEIARANIEKLQDRKRRGVICGSGDTR